MLVTLEHIVKEYGAQPVLRDLSLTVVEGDRIGLIGPNGSGKTTLLRLMTGLEEPDAGEIAFAGGVSIGYLGQHSGLDENGTLFGEMRSVFTGQLEVESRMQAIEREMESAGLSPERRAMLGEEYARLHTRFEDLDGYQMEVKIRTVLNGMGFGDRAEDTPIATLSGGEKTRLALARLLLESPSLLLLDEPTNHLDFKTALWLEDYLADFKGAVLAVSHDRYFLDRMAKVIYEMDEGTLLRFPGNYTAYLPQKEQYLRSQRKAYELQQQEIADLQDYIDRNRVRASTAKRAHSRILKLDKLERIERPHAGQKPPHIRFTTGLKSYEQVLDVEHLDLVVGEPPARKTLLRDVNLEVKRGDRIAIIGENGVGKSTFLKLLLDKIPKGPGEIYWGRNVQTAHYDQEIRELSRSKRVIDEIWDRHPGMSELQVRSLLGSVGLTGDHVFKAVADLSGGERAKVRLAELMLEHANVLLLDEPTNHLDLMAKEALEEALLDFEGTLLIVSHDRYLLNKIPTRILELTRQGAREYQGGFDQYLTASRLREEREAAAAPAAVKAPSAAARGKARRRDEAQRRQRIGELERTIEALEGRIAELEREIADPVIASDYLALGARCEELDRLRPELSEAIDRWTELSDGAEG